MFLKNKVMAKKEVHVNRWLPLSHMASFLKGLSFGAKAPKHRPTDMHSSSCLNPFTDRNSAFYRLWPPMASCKLVLGAARGKRNQSGAGCTAQPQQPTPSMTCFDFIQHCHSPATLEDWSSGRIVCFLSGYDGASHHQPGKTEADLHPCRQLGGTERGVRTAVRTTYEVQEAMRKSHSCEQLVRLFKKTD